MKRGVFILFVMFSVSCNDQQTAGDKPKPISAEDTAKRELQPSGAMAAAGDTVNQHPVLNETLVTCILSEISYCKGQDDSIRKYLPGWSLVWDPAAINGNHCFIAKKDSLLVLSIRGSLLEFSEAAFNNWVLQDLNVKDQLDWPFSAQAGAKVSVGAFTGWKNITDMRDNVHHQTLLQFVDSACGPGSTLLITGHSLGGNLSTVCASWLYDHFHRSTKPLPGLNVITYAAPAAGNEAFAADYLHKFPGSTRYENVNDIVPKFPVADRVADLGHLYYPGPMATEIKVGYGFLKMGLTNVFTGMQLTLKGIGIANGNSPYMQTNGNGFPVQVPLSGKFSASTVANWFAEAGYQHSMEQYAKALGAPVIHTQ